MSISLLDRLEIATTVVKKAGALILELWSNEINEEFKVDLSPVTKADRASENLIKSTILSAFPKDGFLGEETGRLHGESGLYWSCDPIDGTWSYLNHEDTCTVCLSLHEGNKTLLTVIFNPFTGALYRGSEGGKPTRNDRLLPLVHKYKLEDSVVNFFISDNRDKQVAKLYQLRKEQIISKLVSQGGSIAHSLAQVAAGINSAFVGVTNRPSKIWDLAGGVFLIRQAGGKATNLQGEDMDEVPSGEVFVASSHPSIHESFLSALNAVNFGQLLV